MKQNTRMSNFFTNAFYHSKFMDNVFVIKASGDLIEDDQALHGLIDNIKTLTLHGIKILLVYGGGKATDKALETKGIAVKKENGRRITDLDTLNVMKEVIGGTLALKITEKIAELDVEGVSLNAVPADWISAKLRSKTPIDYGYVGDITLTRQRSILRGFKVANFIAVPCLCWAQEDNTLCNINADTVATELAIGADAHKLLFLSNVDGVLKDGKTLPMITDQDIPRLIEDGTVSEGMRVKMENCARALEAGVKRIHLINGMRDNALKHEIFEAVGPGTMVLSEDEKEIYENEIKIQKAIAA